MDPGSTQPSPTVTRAKRTPAETAIVPIYTVDVFDEQQRQITVDDVRDLALAALAYLGVETTHVDITLVERDRMTQLNHTHMGHDAPTDVLAFPLDQPGEGHEGVPALLGDVVICPEVAAAQAAAAGHSIPEEMELLLVHGILHLLGHDHAEPEERRVMFNLTDAILAAYREDHR